MAKVPWLDTVTIPNANQNYVLLDLIQVADAAFNMRRSAAIGIQADKDAGAAVFFIGNAGMSGTKYGCSLVATQLYSIAFELNLIMLDDIHVRCTVAGQLLHLTLVTK